MWYNLARKIPFELRLVASYPVTVELREELPGSANDMNAKYADVVSVAEVKDYLRKLPGKE